MEFTNSELYFAFSGLFNAVVSTFFGLFIYLKSRHNKVNQTFALFCLAVAVWSFPYIFWPIAKTEEATLLWFQLLHIGASFAPITYLHFVVTWLDLKNRRNKVIVILGYILAFTFASSVFSKYFIAGMAPSFSMRYWAQPGILYHFYLLFFFGYVVYSSFLLYINYRNAIGIKRTQIKYILAGIGLAFIGGSTNYPLWYKINFPPYGNILASSYVILTAYAIVRHRLMDIKLVFRRYSVFLFSLFTVTIIALSIKYIFFTFFFDIFYWADFLVLVLAITFFPVIRDIFYRLANKHFFSSLYESQEVIAGLSEKLRSTLELNTIFDFIHESLDGAFHTKSFGVLGYNEKQDNYFIQYNRGFKVDKRKRFPNNPSLHKLFISRNEPIVVEEIRHAYYGRRTKDIIDLLIKYEVSILAPLNIKGKTIGLIVLGAKESGDMYNDEDLKVLKTVGAQAAISIENALLYRETINFNVKLAQEVERATFDLKAANEKLKKLDAAKSEFISIASHQLRTPLTVIKGYISMMLEGNFGKLTVNESQALDKVYDSNERLIQLVENLLNISRIESGRLQFTYEVMNLEDLAASVFEELSNPAKKKGLALTFNRPPKPLPPVKIDEEKIRQVLMNLVDNAIKYTKKGTVALEVKKSHNNIHFCVSDSGMGIDKSDMPNLFRKFSRGQGTSVVHTEGTGLGLYVARQMVKAHSGKIWAASGGKEKGAKFCFKIPINTD